MNGTVSRPINEHFPSAYANYVHFGDSNRVEVEDTMPIWETTPMMCEEAAAPDNNHQFIAMLWFPVLRPAILY